MDANLPIAVKLYRLWSAVKQRVKRSGYYKRNGIRMCEEWFNNPQLFIEYCIGNGYSPGLYIDRIDPYGDYEPGNVRFVTKEVSGYNRTNTQYYQYNGNEYTVKELYEIGKPKLSLAAFQARLISGWSVQDAIDTPIVKHQVRVRKKSPIPSKWRSWYSSLYSRCYNSLDPAYSNYGGRGIHICKEWLDDKESFYRWCVDNGYNKGLQMDRIDNSGPYAPWNCRYVDCSTNNRNRRSSHMESYNGDYLSLPELAEKYKIPYNMLRNRIYSLKWDIARALETPPYVIAKATLVVYKGNTYSIRGICRELEIDHNKVHKLRKKGVLLWDAIEKVYSTTHNRNLDNV